MDLQKTRNKIQKLSRIRAHPIHCFNISRQNYTVNLCAGQLSIPNGGLCCFNDSCTLLFTGKHTTPSCYKS